MNGHNFSAVLRSHFSQMMLLFITKGELIIIKLGQ